MRCFALAAVAFLMAGCASVQPVQPSGPRATWSAWNGPWVRDFEGCGFCPPGPHSRLLAIDGEGRALVAVVGYGNAKGNAYLNGTAPWKPVLDPMLDDAGGAFEVFSVHVGALNATEWSAVRAPLEDGLARAHEPRPSATCCVVDGASQRLWADGRTVDLVDGNDDGGGGWRDVRDQMRLVGAWLA